MNLPAQIAILGASGDLTARKLIPALSNLAAKGLPPAGFSVVGMARRSKTDESFREELRQHLSPQDLAAFAALAPRIHYVEGDASPVRMACEHSNAGSTRFQVAGRLPGCSTCRSSPSSSSPRSPASRPAEHGAGSSSRSPSART